MGLLDKLRKRNKEEKIGEINTQLNEDIKKTSFFEPSFYEKYPDGLPLEVLELIDYKHFGALLKQKQLLPPSYDRKPVKVEIDGVCDKPRVILTFKSTTSDSEREISIYGYTVASSSKKKDALTILEVNGYMIEEWYKFAERVMWNWDRGYRSNLMHHERRGDTPVYHVDEASLKRIREIEKKREMAKNLMQEDYDYIESMKEIAKWNKKAENNNDLN